MIALCYVSFLIITEMASPRRWCLILLHVPCVSLSSSLFLTVYVFNFYPASADFLLFIVRAKKRQKETEKVGCAASVYRIHVRTSSCALSEMLWSGRKITSTNAVFMSSKQPLMRWRAGAREWLGSRFFSLARLWKCENTEERTTGRLIHFVYFFPLYPPSLSPSLTDPTCKALPSAACFVITLTGSLSVPWTA